MKMKQSKLYVLLAVLIGAAFAPGVLAAQVDARLSSTQAYVGVPVVLYVTIANAADHEPPQLPQVAGLDFALAGTPSIQSQTTIINGRTTHNETLTYAIRVTPRQAGQYVIPALTVTADGKAFTTPAYTLTAVASETGDLLFTEIEGLSDAIYVGEPLPLTLRVGIRPFVDEAREIELDEAQMWSRISQDHSDWGIFTDTLVAMAQQGQRPSGRVETRVDDHGETLTYYVYEISASAYPNNAGTAEIGTVHVVAAYPTGLEETRDFFGRVGLRLAGVRPITASAGAPDIAIRPIPTEGRPDDFRGAVGRYTIETRAEPREVDAGDPVTLAIRVRGNGPTHLLPAPPLADLPRLTDDFVVPDEPLAGVVQGDAKVFTTKIRPKTTDAAAIPAISYSFFDPDSERFETVMSQPIAIEVREGKRLDLSRIVSANGVDIGSNAAGGERSSSFTGSDDTGQAAHVFFANMPIDSANLSGNAPRSNGFVIVLALLVAPLFFTGAVLVRHMRESTVSDPGGKHTLKQIASIQTLDELAQTVRTFASQRLGLPGGATHQEIVDRMREQGIDARTLDRWLTTCETARYAPGLAHEMESMRVEATRCIRDLEAQR